MMIRGLAALVCVAGFAFSCADKPNYGTGNDAGSGGSPGGGTGGMSGGATGGGSGGMLADTTTQNYEADDPNIQYVGRINFTNPKQVRFDLNAVSITARFMGTAVAVSLRDEFRYSKYVNSYDAVIDGKIVATVVPNRTAATKYVVANALADGEHQITLVRRTEAAAGAGYFTGFSFAGTILPPPARPTRRLEFLGDSITAGAGMEAPNGSPLCNAPPDGWGLPVENANKAFGPVIARMLGAEVHVMGVSGIGLVQNYSNQYDARTLPQVYDLYSPELMDMAGKMDLPRWDAAQRATWIPDGIVIGLGTNDFSPEAPDDPTQPHPRPALTAEAFAAGHIAFIDKLRGYYPDAHIFITNSTTVLSPALEMALKMVVDHYVAGGDLRVHSFMYAKIAGAGCVTHPNVAQHEAMAAALGPVIKTTLGW